MPQWKVHLEFEEGNSSKFWRARIEGKTLYVNYGRIGTTGQMTVKELASPAEAQRELDKLEKEKRKKGYEDAASEGADDADEAEDEGEEEEAEDEDGDEEEEEDEDEDEDDEDEKPRKGGGKAAAKPSAPAGASVKLSLGGKRTIETRLVLEGSRVRVEADESYDSPEKARQAFDRIKQALIDEGYKEK